MIFIKTFWDSLKLPSKQALFRLNRVGMDIVVIYLFILLLFVSIPALVDQIAANSTSTTKMNIVFLFIYFFIFYYLPVTVFMLILISIVTYIAVLLTKLFERKLRYSILWKMTAFTATIPFIVFTVLAFFYDLPQHFFWLAIIYTLLMLVKMITIYPRRTIKK